MGVLVSVDMGVPSMILLYLGRAWSPRGRCWIDRGGFAPEDSGPAYALFAVSDLSPPSAFLACLHPSRGLAATASRIETVLQQS